MSEKIISAIIITIGILFGAIVFNSIGNREEVERIQTREQNFKECVEFTQNLDWCFDKFVKQ